MGIKFLKRLSLPFLKLWVSGIVAFGLQHLAVIIFEHTGTKITIPYYVSGFLTLLIFALFNIVFKHVILPVIKFTVMGFLLAFGLFIVDDYFNFGFLKTSISQQYTLIITTIVSIAIVLYFKYKNHFIAKSLEEIDNLGNGDPRKGGFLFEEYIAEMYRRLGYDAHTTGELKKRKIFKTKGFDQGADIVINFIENGVQRRAIVQCKLYKNAVGNEAVQEIVAARPLYNADYAIVLTNNFFTDAAIELAQVNNVFLVDRKQLGILIDKAKNPKLAQMVQGEFAA